MRKRSGVTRKDRARMLAAQGGGCAICGTSEPGAKGWALDHDHSCCPSNGKDDKTCGKCIRGVLCQHCNRGLGFFRDDPETLRAAIKYLKRKPSK